MRQKRQREIADEKTRHAELAAGEAAQAKLEADNERRKTETTLARSKLSLGSFHVGMKIGWRKRLICSVKFLHDIEMWNGVLLGSPLKGPIRIYTDMDLFASRQFNLAPTEL